MFYVFLLFFYGSSSLREASGTHLALISACSVRANSLYEVLPGVLRLVDRFLPFFSFRTVFYRFLLFLYSVLTVFLPFCLAIFLRVFAGDLKQKKTEKTAGAFFLQLRFNRSYSSTTNASTVALATVSLSASTTFVE